MRHSITGEPGADRSRRLRRSPLVALAAIAAAASLTVPASASLAATSPTAAVQAGSAAGSDHGAEMRAARSHADAALAKVKSALRAGAADSFVGGPALVDSDGTGHVRYSRRHSGLPVLGGDIVVHVDHGGELRGVSSSSRPVALNVNTTPSVASSAAVATARSFAASQGIGIDGATATLAIDATNDAVPAALVWDVLVSGTAADGTPSRTHVLVGGDDNDVRQSWDEIETGTGNSLYDGQVSFSTSRNSSTGLYEMKDASRGSNYTTDLKGATSGTGTQYTDSDDVWGNSALSDRASAGVDASYGAQMTFDYYKNVLGRNGIYNNGSGVRSRVHYGSGYNNAFWDGTQMTYGDGPSNSHPLVSLDVAGHEMSHGVTENTANLTYSGESGGLNEATSDIFGTMVEFYANNPSDPGDYLIGEKLGTPFRYMDRPSRDGASPDCWSSTLGSLNVHYSSGPANHAFYLLAEGSGAKTLNGVSYNSPTCNSSTVTGVGRDAAAKIWYRALSVYMTSSTDYAGARTATVKAATDLYGAASAQCAAVERAFSAISVSGATCAGSTGGGTGGTGGTGTNVVGNPGFESGAVSWTASSGVINNDSTVSHSGSWEAWLDGYGTTHTDTLSQSVTLPAGASGTLGFWLRVATNESGSTAYDRLRVQVVSGTTTTTLATYSNVNASSGCVQRSLNLTPWVGKTVTLKFVGTEDSSLATSFLLDDVSAVVS